MAPLSFRSLVLPCALLALAPGAVAPGASASFEADGTALLDVLGDAEAAGEGQEAPSAFDPPPVRRRASHHRSDSLESKLGHLSQQAAQALGSGGAVPLDAMRQELDVLREELHANVLLRSQEANGDKVGGSDWDAKVETMEQQIQDLEEMLKALAAQEAKSQRRLVTVSHAELQAEIDRLKKAVAQMETTDTSTEVLPPEEPSQEKKKLSTKVTPAEGGGSEGGGGAENQSRRQGRRAERGNAAEGEGQAGDGQQREGAEAANVVGGSGDGEVSRGRRGGPYAGPDGSGPDAGPDGSRGSDVGPGSRGPEAGTGSGDGGGSGNRAASTEQHGPAGPASALDDFGSASGGNEGAGDSDGDQSPGGHDLDVDTSMPYGHLEPFGREDTARELTEASIRESDAMVDQLERAEVAEEKRAIFRALTRLRGAAITSFDGVARAQTGNLDEYSRKNRWRRAHPLRHLAEEEADVSRWAFPDGSDF